MIKFTATTQIPMPPKVSQPVSFGWRRFYLTLTFRLILLGIGGSVATAVGIAAAQLYPAQTQEPPSVERLLQQAQSLLKVESLDRWNLFSSDNVFSPDTVPSPEPSAPTVPAPAATAASLTDSERQQLQAELTQLQAELQTLTSQSTEPLAERVEEIQKRIQSIQQNLSRFADSPLFERPMMVASAGSPLMVTLPSDTLFATAQATLTPETKAILNSILTDLQGYPGAGIQVSAHTDQQGTDETDRHRSLEQAKAVQQYLSTQVGEGIHWVTVGYGHSRPIALDDSPENRQRNRRIEITINPE